MEYKKDVIIKDLVDEYKLKTNEGNYMKALKKMYSIIKIKNNNDPKLNVLLLPQLTREVPLGNGACGALSTCFKSSQANWEYLRKFPRCPLKKIHDLYRFSLLIPRCTI